jgi:ADP-heptose:LPS heptosyltransferase
LTRAPFADFARALPWFDLVIIDSCPTATQISGWARLRNEIKAFAPSRVYDLQGKNRQTVLYALLGGPFGPAWSGAAPLCKFPRPWPPKPKMHFTYFLAAQLRTAGVPAAPPPDLKELDAQTGKFDLPERYVVLIPGCSPRAPQKRWPPQKYAVMANKLHEQNLACVTVGTEADAKAIETIKTTAPNIIDFCGHTNVLELAGILRRAVGVMGNDTGPLHLAAALNVPTLALFSEKSNPVWSRPQGTRVAVLQSPVLADLNVGVVIAAFKTLLEHAEGAS